MIPSLTLYISVRHFHGRKYYSLSGKERILLNALGLFSMKEHTTDALIRLRGMHFWVSKVFPGCPG